MHQNVAKEKTETWTGLDLAKNMTKQVEDQTEGEKKKSHLACPQRTYRVTSMSSTTLGGV